MKKTRFTEAQRVKILREADKTPVAEVAKKPGVRDVTIDAWRKRFGQLEAAGAPEPVHLGEVERHVMIEDRMLHPGPCSRNLVIRLGEFLQIVVAGEQRVHIRLHLALLHHLQDDRGVLGVILVPGVEEGVIPPFLMAARSGVRPPGPFCIGVMPPKPMLGRS